MAKQEDLKIVDLKVTVNCCDGCKRKVLKALSIKGVLQTEIHPALPKITVIGNVDTAVLIKKLAKVGKTAEILRETENQTKQTEEKKPENDEKTKENNNKKDKKEKKQVKECIDDKSKFNSEPDKSETPVEAKKSNENEDKNDGKNGEQAAKECNDGEATKITTNPTVITNGVPHMSYLMNQNMLQNYANLMGAHAGVYYHPMDPAVMPTMRYYNMNAYSTLSPNCHYARNSYYYDLPTYQTRPHQAHSTSFADYFNEDNTIGCHVM